MKYINRQNFIKGFSSIKHSKHLKTKEVAQHCNLSPQYLYYLSSPKSTASKKVKMSVIYEIAKGLNLNDSQTKSWISTMNNTPNTQNISNNYPRNDQYKQHDNTRSINYNHPIVNVKYIHVGIDLQKIIKRAMFEKKLNVHQLASRSHLNHNYIYKLINGQVPYISKITMIKVAKGLGMNVNVMVKPDSFSTINSRYLNKKNIHSNNKLISDLRPSVLRATEDMSKLPDADVNIIDLLINRLINTRK